MYINRLRNRGRYLGDVPFQPMLDPVSVNIPNPVVPGLTDEPGVSTDDSGMSVVTVVGSRSPAIPWWVWATLAAGAYFVMTDKSPILRTQENKRRENPDSGVLGGFTIKDAVVFGGIGLAAYALWQTLSAAGKAADAAGHAVSTGYNAAVNWTSDLFTQWFGSDPTGTNVYHIVNFLDDGSRHAIGANIVNSTGQFQWTGYPAGSQSAAPYQLGKDASGNWVASPV